MLLLPAIDLYGGVPVRLQKGVFATSHQVAASALGAAEGFIKSGAKWLHVVDLDGAKDGLGKNKEVIFSLANLPINIEVGGGIRDMATIEEYLSHGVKRVILGSAAVENPDLVKQAVKTFGEHIAVGIDAADGYVAARGWVKTSTVTDIDLARQMESAGVQTLIVTDIQKDGMQAGPNFAQLEKINEAVSCQVIASGGVSSLQDLLALAEKDFYGAILGKAIYTGAVDLNEAVALLPQTQG